ncbi:MAG: histidine phosphatase family protein [Liquorilactobacillus nagelii]|uniref:histidine phosphatase family protein n=1 Tax=Liquorilactobacillus nagelii TaxID=82688 RepID=UPI0024332721|nr:histidine phosphatase family protein [Liquorilactobacillus nagelii]MCI1634486.1 histidine phosphatase family protein [Liquorilactobacillus nagelii]MCI1920401.1 histidine phosphatase family protein [Liquorilactobacillus nagelii]MCI1976045.1 histidine phosphatase family protein [Liquorilactobacillus nagelii]
MTKLFFIRHGKTQWNLEGRYQGAHGDSPLLPSSYQEIKQLVNFLKKYQFGAIYSSPIQRALITATEIAKELPQQLQVQSVAGLREFDLGKMEGMKFSDVALKYPQELAAFRHHADQYQAKKIAGESFPELFQRMTPAIEQIVAAHPQENVLLVSHGAALCAEIRHLLGYSLADLRANGGLANTSTTILKTTTDEKFECLAWNKTDYLERKITASDIV